MICFWFAICVYFVHVMLTFMNALHCDGNEMKRRTTVTTRRLLAVNTVMYHNVCVDYIRIFTPLVNYFYYAVESISVNSGV